MAIIRKGTQQLEKDRVGQSIGERREIQQRQTQAPKPQARKPLDKFAGVSGGKSQKSLAGFAPNATYNQARRFSVAGTPYKKPLHEHIEKGSAPVAGSKKPPSDRAILNFLDRVIQSAPQATRTTQSKPVQASSAANRVQVSQRRVAAHPQAGTTKA
jgi:hypothetical protein